MNQTALAGVVVGFHAEAAYPADEMCSDPATGGDKCPN